MIEEEEEEENYYVRLLSKSQEENSVNTLSTFENEVPNYIKFKPEDQWMVGVSSLICNPIHHFNSNDDKIIFTPQLFNDKSFTWEPSITLESFINACLKYSHNPQIYNTELYFSVGSGTYWKMVCGIDRSSS